MSANSLPLTIDGLLAQLARQQAITQALAQEVLTLQTLARSIEAALALVLLHVGPVTISAAELHAYSFANARVMSEVKNGQLHLSAVVEGKNDHVV